MKRDFVFKPKHFGSDAAVLTQRFIDIIMANRNRAALAVKLCMDEYADILSVAKIDNDPGNVYVFCDINPIKQIALSNDRVLLTRTISLNLPFSAEGMIFAPGIEDPMFPYGRNGKRSAMLTYMPSLIESVMQRKGNSTFFKIPSSNSLTKIIEMYSSERSIEKMVSFPDKLTQIVSSNTFGIKNIKSWKKCEDICNADSITKGIVKGAGLDRYILSILKGVDEYTASQDAEKYLANRQATRDKVSYVYKEIHEGNGYDYFEHFREMASLKSVSGSMQLGTWADVGTKIHRDIMINGVSPNATIMSSLLRQLAASASITTGKPKVKCELAITLGLTGIYDDADRRAEVALICDMAFDRKRISGQCSSKQADEIYRTFKWLELAPKLTSCNKKHYLTEDLGI